MISPWPSAKPRRRSRLPPNTTQMAPSPATTRSSTAASDSLRPRMSQPIAADRSGTSAKIAPVESGDTVFSASNIDTKKATKMRPTTPARKMSPRSTVKTVRLASITPTNTSDASTKRMKVRGMG